MVKIATISIKQVSNGIILHWRGADDKGDPVIRVVEETSSPDDHYAHNLGIFIWEDIKQLLEFNKKLTVSFSYESLKSPDNE